jgi:hypothetical protein
MFEFVSCVITDTRIADSSISRENVLGCQLSFIFSASDRPLEPTPHARHTRTQNRYGCQNVRNAATSRMRNADDAEEAPNPPRIHQTKRNGRALRSPHPCSPHGLPMLMLSMPCTHPSKRPDRDGAPSTMGAVRTTRAHPLSHSGLPQSPARAAV